MLMTKRDLKTNPQPGLNGALFVVAGAEWLNLWLNVLRNNKKAGVEDG